MTEHSAEAVRKHVRTYMNVFIALAVLTAATVAIAYVHIPAAVVAVGVAIVIAAVKSSLVAGFFMHLIGEKRVIFWVLILTGAFFVVLMMLPLLTEKDSMATPSAPRVEFVLEHSAGAGETH